MHLAGGQREVETFQDLAAIDIDVKVLDLKHYDVSLTSGTDFIILVMPGLTGHPVILLRGYWMPAYAGMNMHYPTLPPAMMPISFCVSAMNSMGRCWSTSRTKPLTISATASSGESPRDRQ